MPRMADALQWLSGLRAGRLALVALVAAAGTAGALSWQVQRSDTSPQLDSRNPAATVAADTDGSTVPGTERPTLVVVPDDDGPPARLAIAGEEVPDGTEPDADPPESTDPGPAPTDAPTGDEVEASTTTPDRTTPTPVARTGARFATLPPGSTLPSGAACAARVRPTPENVPENRPYNQARGRKPTGTYLSTNAAIGRNDYERRLDGDFVGTTDEIIQWAACKWGFDEDLVRAQVYA